MPFQADFSGGASAGPAATMAADLRRAMPMCCTRSNNVRSGGACGSLVRTGTSKLGAAATAAPKAAERSLMSRR